MNGGDNMVLVAFEMISPELGEYLADMNIYERELMLIDYKIKTLRIT